jgi:diaminohydroxyphosphoribosylaminopyrimidine deaminase/5-amino-6-(5-phosphoribosylamino)uracil reductase
MTALDDLRYMDTALALAIAQLGRTAPNPAVGCVLVANNRIIATGATADGGRPHAERLALDAVGSAARNAVAYVTLEPCSFHGQTPPCAAALIEAGVARVVIACEDAHPKVSGRGMTMLEAAGIRVESGLRAQAAAHLYEGFFHRLETGRPRLYLDARSERYDAVLDGTNTQQLETRLDEMGARGLNRVCVGPTSPLGQAVRRREEHAETG